MGEVAFLIIMFGGLLFAAWMSGSEGGDKMAWPPMYDGETSRNPNEPDIKADDAKDQNQDSGDKK